MDQPLSNMFYHRLFDARKNNHQGNETICKVFNATKQELLKLHQDKTEEIEMIMIKPDHVKQEDDDDKCRMMRQFDFGSLNNMTQRTILQNVPARNSQFIYQQKNIEEHLHHLYQLLEGCLELHQEDETDS